MVTIFACPKPFRGHAGAIQRNAIKTWMRLHPRPEVILFGDDEGTSEVTQELGLRHISAVQHSEWGTPLVSDMFEKVQALASHDVLCYVNADILLLDGLVDAVKHVASWRDRFLMAGRKTDIDLDQAAACKSEEDQERLLVQVSQRKKAVWPGALEYFVFSRGLFADIPPFGIGRTVWDNWLVWKARSLRVSFVDASALIIAAHPIHDYSHHPQGRRGVYQGEEAIWNQSLAGRHLGTIEDATHKLTLRGIERNVGQLLVRRTRSVRHLLGIRRDNVESVMSRFGLLKA